MNPTSVETDAIPAVLSDDGARFANSKSGTQLMPRIDRRYAPLEASIAHAAPWLSDREQAELATWRDPGRRTAWLVGRTLAKQLVADRETAPSGDAGATPRIDILSRDEAGRVNRPRIWCDGVARPWSLSISHTRRGVLAVLSTATGVALGVDLTEADSFSDRFVGLWFTPAERAWFGETQSTTTGQFIWAAKEAIYKACNTGESFAPRDVEVRADGRCRYRDTWRDDCRLQSWNLDGQLAVLAVARSQRDTQQ